MNRPIKFRVWDVQGRKMFEPESIANNMVGCNPEDDDEQFFIHMQFSGFEDSNGVGIYEGDELMYIATSMSNMVVKFQDGCFVGEGPFNTHPLKVYLESDDLQSIEVVGNIYDNSELLK
jgi:hypothetical protein